MASRTKLFTSFSKEASPKIKTEVKFALFSYKIEISIFFMELRKASLSSEKKENALEVE